MPDDQHMIDINEVAIINPAGETNGDTLRVDFDRRLSLNFRSSVVTSNAISPSLIENATRQLDFQ